jgi:hypothetical protein
MLLIEPNQLPWHVYKVQQHRLPPHSNSNSNNRQTRAGNQAIYSMDRTGTNLENGLKFSNNDNESMNLGRCKTNQCGGATPHS